MNNLNPLSSEVGWHPALYEWYFTSTPIGRRLRARERSVILPALSALVHKGDVVLDVGCGPGTYTISIARRCRKVVAVDPSQAMLGYMRARLEREGVSNVDGWVGRLPDQLGVDESCDGVLAVGVLNYLPDLDAALRGLTSALKPTGWALLTVPPRSREGRLHAFTDLLMGRRVYLRSAREVDEACARLGMSVERIATVGLTRGGIAHVFRARLP